MCQRRALSPRPRGRGTPHVFGRTRAARGEDRMMAPTSTDIRTHLVEMLRRDLIGPRP